MSSLWTPGGEVPVSSGSSEAGTAPPTNQQEQQSAPGTEASEAELYAAYEQMQRQLLETPAADVIAREAVAIYELAALHLGQSEPRLDEARLAIDAVAGLLDAVGDRLGAVAPQLTDGLHQLRLAYVQRANSTADPAEDSAQPASPDVAKE